MELNKVKTTILYDSLQREIVETQQDLQNLQREAENSCTALVKIGAAGEDLDALRAKAREMGSQTKFSVSEAGEALTYMAMTGWKQRICWVVS